MSEFRQNPITKQWVLIAPARGKRPDQYATYSVMHGVPEVDVKCVFCPGNEHLNVELLRMGADGRVHAHRGKTSSGDWQIRIIPNKFAALEHSPQYSHKEFY